MNKEIIERLNEIKRVVDSNSLEELIDNLIKDIENGKIH